MKSIFSLVVFVVLIQSFSCETLSLFQNFISEYEKNYYGEEFAKRFEIFNENLKLIDYLNNYPGQTAEYAINEFADMTQEEFEQGYLMEKREAPQHNSDKYLPDLKNIKDIPSEFNWADNSSIVTPVQNQGSCGTCWIFSLTGNIEGQWALAGHGIQQLSIEQLVECDATQDPDNDKKADCSIFGGWPYLGMDYVHRVGGIASDADYPYCVCTSSIQCNPCSPQGYNTTRCGHGQFPPSCNSTIQCKEKTYTPAAKISGWKKISTDEDQIAAQLVQNGPFSVLLDASSLQFYKKGIFKPIFGCSKTALNHGVLMTGYGEDNGKPYWMIKNSWGTKFGIDGYFKIVRGTGECGINTEVITAII